MLKILMASTGFNPFSAATLTAGNEMRSRLAGSGTVLPGSATPR